MEHDHPITHRRPRIPAIVWVIGLGLLVTLGAILFFDVSTGAAVIYGVFTAFMVGHHSLHGGHGGHSENHDQPPEE